MAKKYLTPGTLVHVNEPIGLSQASYDAEVYHHDGGQYGFGVYVTVKHPGQQPNAHGQLTTWQVSRSCITVL